MKGALLFVLAVVAAGCAGPALPTTSAGANTGQSTSPAGGGPAGAMPGQHGELVRPAHADNRTQGLHIVGDESASGLVAGGNVTFFFQVSNEGENATVAGGLCGFWPYRFTLRDSNGTAHPFQVATPTCEAVNSTAFSAGSTYNFEVAWNGTYAVGDHLEAAPPGAYALTAAFEAQRGNETAAVEATLPVNVVENRGEL
ncbi:MAG: hypothetical protein ACYDBQ_11360 [Thermoplasmatota archaeon]